MKGTKGDEDAKLRWLDCLTSEVPQSVGVALVVEMNPSLSASSQAYSAHCSESHWTLQVPYCRDTEPPAGIVRDLHGNMYVKNGCVKESRFKARREAVVALLDPGDFFGEACMAQVTRKKHAIAMAPTAALVIDKTSFVRVLQTRRALANRFIAPLLTRNRRIEEAVVDLERRLRAATGADPAFDGARRQAG